MTDDVTDDDLAEIRRRYLDADLPGQLTLDDDLDGWRPVVDVDTGGRL